MSKKGIKNMPVPDEILQDALTLKPEQKAELVDKLISSLDKPDKEIDELWANEAESRLDAYEQGKIKAVALEKVLEKYK
jgi:putative addiction module component (TIGR02574 family)